jgi:hypothetical protein
MNWRATQTKSACADYSAYQMCNYRHDLRARQSAKADFVCVAPDFNRRVVLENN